LWAVQFCWWSCCCPIGQNPELTTASSPHEVTTTVAITPERSAPVTKPSLEKSEITILPFASDLETDLIRHDNPEASRLAVDQILFFYRRMFGGNPVGQNEDITAALLGANKERVAFIPPDSPAIKNGKLIDPWGTPYWFHAQSGQEMEIHSAGPDQELFTTDDLPGTDPQQREDSLPE
jgi:hypothetical protein